MKIDQAKAYKLYILEHVSFDGYDEHEPTNQAEKIASLQAVFMSEYGYFVKRDGIIKALEDWLRGLPSVVDLPFYNHDIEQLLKTLGVIDSDTKEARIEQLVENYWHYTANQISQLFSGFRVPKESEART